jgi:hypothetical protein
MTKTTKFLAVYAIISGFSMIVIWGIFYATGFVADKISQSPVAFWAILLADTLTAAALLFGGFGLVKEKKWGANLAFVSMGMLLYAVTLGCGEFAQRRNPYLACLFAALILATIVVLLVKVFPKDR